MACVREFMCHFTTIIITAHLANYHYNYYSPIEEIMGVVTSFTFQISGIPEGKSCVFISA